MIFVFGSNLAGRHGKGAAWHAMQHCGAIYGQGRGLQGHSYAIPTKDECLKTRSLEQIKEDIDVFLEFARSNFEMKFQVTRIGCGLAGYKDYQIAPMFINAPVNCVFESKWIPYIQSHRGEAD